MSIVSDECIYFRACPHLFKEFAQCVRLRWRQDSPYFFGFVFVLRISSWESKMRHKAAINHNLWSYLLLWEKSFNFFFFFQLKENGLWHLSSRKYLAVCRVLISCNSLRVFYLFFFFFTHVFLGSHCMTAHEGRWTLTPPPLPVCVCLVCGHGQGTVAACAEWRPLYLSSLLSLGVAMLLTNKNNFKQAHKVHTHFWIVCGALSSHATFPVWNNLPLGFT